MSSELSFGQVLALARTCFDAAGGLPQETDPEFLRSRWSDTAFAAPASGGGHLPAAAAVRPGPIVHFLAAPGAPADVAGRVLDDALAAAGGPATVESESVTPAIDRLFASRGLRQVFAEDVMGVDLATAGLDAPGLPGVTLLEWGAETSRRFFDVYRASFRDRPGFPDPSAAEWIDDEYHASWSLLAHLDDGGDAGFVTAAPEWIVQVGVIPAARGRGLAGLLLRESLRRMRTDGERTVWLTVNVDNPARRGYERLGFTPRGRRGRYRP